MLQAKYSHLIKIMIKEQLWIFLFKKIFNLIVCQNKESYIEKKFTKAKY